MPRADLGQFDCRAWVAELRRTGQLAWMRHEPTPWLYQRTDPRYARDWPYTLLQFHGGFRMRVYDWEMF